MLHSVQNMIGFTLGAIDGEIGKVKDIYFDDKSWQLRYLVVETGNWLFGRKVLIAPVAIQDINIDSHMFLVNLTKDQVKHSPDIDTEKPFTAQDEASLNHHYSWPVNVGAGVGFVTTGMVGGVVAPDIPFEERIAQEFNDSNENKAEASQDPHEERSHLRSFKEFNDYKIFAADSEFGQADDLLIDTKTWSIPFMVIEAGTWYSNKQLFTPTNGINKIDSTNATIFVDQTSTMLKESPEYDSHNPIDPDLENDLRRYYNLS